MCILKIEDHYGSFECMLFPKVFEKFKSALEEDKMVTVMGKLSIRDGEAPIITTDNITFWKEKEEEKEKPKDTRTLYIRFDTSNTAIYNKVMLILKMYSGDVPVVCKCTAKNQVFKVNHNVSPNNLLINELIGVLDETSVVLK